MRANATQTDVAPRQRTGTLPAFDELTSEFKFEFASGPIPLTGDRPRGVSALKFVRNAMLHTLGLFAVLLVGTGTAWPKAVCRILLPRNEPAAATRIAFAKTSCPMNSRWRPACRSTAIMSVPPAARSCKAAESSTGKPPLFRGLEQRRRRRRGIARTGRPRQP